MLLNVGWARGFAKKARGCCVNVSPNGLIASLLCFVFSLRSAGWSWRLELEWCERKIMLSWLELMAGVV